MYIAYMHAQIHVYCSIVVVCYDGTDHIVLLNLGFNKLIKWLSFACPNETLSEYILEKGKTVYFGFNWWAHVLMHSLTQGILVLGSLICWLWTVTHFLIKIVPCFTYVLFTTATAFHDANNISSFYSSCQEDIAMFQTLLTLWHYIAHL